MSGEKTIQCAEGQLTSAAGAGEVKWTNGFGYQTTREQVRGRELKGRHRQDMG